MPMNGSRTQPTRGSMTPPLPSPPMTAPTSRILLDDVRLADGRAVARHAELRGDVLDDARAWTC